MRPFIIAILFFVAAFGIPNVGNESGPAAPEINVPEPSASMKKAVEQVADVLKDAPMGDRMLWAMVWSKAASAVSQDETDDRIIWTTTTELRKFTETALRIGWRRLGGNEAGKYQGLSAAVESAFAEVLTMRVQEVTPEVRKKYVSLCYAMAWAGVGKDQ